jgi:phosphate:Na+ symporter
MESAALFLAGLSLFFYGVNGVREKLQQASGRRLRNILARFTRRPFVAALLGVLAGAVTQSSSAVSFILSGLVATGLIPLRRALPVVAATHVGTALLVFLAALNIHVAILYLIGLTGLMISFRISERHGALIGSLFSIGLLFLGLDLMKTSFLPLPDCEWFQTLAMFIREWPLAPFLLGVALRMFIQSSSAIGVIAMTLQHGGLFDEIQAMILICGTGPGVALSGFFLSGNLSGPPRQIVIYQGMINLLSGCLVGILIMADTLGGHPLLREVLDHLSMNASDRIAWVYFFMMAVCMIAGIAILPRIEPLLKKLSPPDVESDLSRPEFLLEEALATPETATTLVDREQRRFLELCIALLDTAREEGGAGKSENAAAYHQGAKGLNREITEYSEELIARPLDSQTMHELLNLKRRQEMLGPLEECVEGLVRSTRDSATGSERQLEMKSLLESMSLIALTALEAWTNGDPQELEFLLQLTDDRSGMMEKLRKNFRADGNAMSPEDQSALFYATTLFERAVWLMRQLGLTLGGEREG